MAGDDWVAVVVEDDPDIRDLINVVLTQSGFRTVVAEDGPGGLAAVRAHDPLLTTLDVNMPGLDGFSVARCLREFSNTYLIMITSRAEENDVVEGFEAGADDYLVKPFRPRELRARADSMLRRPRPRLAVPVGPGGPSLPDEAEGSPVGTNLLSLNGLVLDQGTGMVTVDGAVVVDLVRAELDLLASLLTTGRRVRSKADLVLTMRGQQPVTSYFVADADKQALETHLASLRRKLGDEGPVPRFVETIRGVGYRAAEPVS